MTVVPTSSQRCTWRVVLKQSTAAELHSWAAVLRCKLFVFLSRFISIVLEMEVFSCRRRLLITCRYWCWTKRCHAIRWMDHVSRDILIGAMYRLYQFENGNWSLTRDPFPTPSFPLNVPLQPSQTLLGEGGTIWSRNLIFRSFLDTRAFFAPSSPQELLFDISYYSVTPIQWSPT